MNTHVQKILIATLGLGSIILPTAAISEPGALATQPLFTQNAIDPNIILGIDDSGSMDSEVLMQTNDGAFWWHTGEETFVGWLGQTSSSTNRGIATPGLPNFNINGAAKDNWKKYVYLFPNGTATGDRIYKDDSNSNNSNHYAIPPVIQYAFMRSPDYNSSYFNPTVSYKPWVSYGVSPTTVTFDQIPEAAAPSDPIVGTSTFKLTVKTTEADSILSNHTFRMYKGMVIPDGTRYHNATWKTAASDTKITATKEIGIPYNPAVYYRKTTVGTYDITNDAPATETGSCATPSAAHYQFFEVRPSSLVVTSGTVDALGPDGGCLIATTITAGSNEMKNFANWFSYYRKRHLALRAGVSLAFEDLSGIRTDLFTINTLNPVTMLDFDKQVGKDSFYSSLYNIAGNSAGTPNRTALNFAGTQYKRTNTNAPVIAECQKNFTIFFTDGFSTLSGSTPGNVDAETDTNNYSGVAPYTDTYSNTLADIAMKYYKETLIPTTTYPAGKVPVSSECDTPTPAAYVDCNTNLHMVTFTVGLGARGTIFNNPDLVNPPYTTVEQVHATPVTWPNVNSARDPRQIDDLYHAAVNGRGQMLNADTPADLQSAMKEALNSLTEQTGSAASVAFNTSVLSTGSVVYQARFDTNKWKGELLSLDLDPITGEVADIADWDAGTLLPDHAQRKIYTYNLDTGKKKGVLFKADVSDPDTLATGTDLPNAAIADIALNLPTISGITPNELTAKDRLNYLRGDRTYEGPDANNKSRFRERNGTALGDIVHSAPLFVGNPALNWPTGDGATAGRFPDAPNDYETWKDGINRIPMVYVGANDGMMHGFNATTGVELMAYIPSSLFSTAANDGLHHLSEPGYQHRYYVDNTASRSDVYTKGRSGSAGTISSRAWRSILVGSLRGGGKSVFALDVTDPGSFGNDASNAAETVLWEFSDTDDANLGLTFSRPTIVPTNAVESNDIRWAAIFGNGYNNGGDCHAELFILFLDGGTGLQGGLDGAWTEGEGKDYIRIDTEVGSTASGDCNGLSNIAVVDLDGDGKADSVYAGDLQGNMWAFDLCNADTTGLSAGICKGTGWGVSGAASPPEPLFIARDANGLVQQITAPPIVISHPTELSGDAPNTLVLFGTGRYIVDSDKDDSVTDTNSHTYYGIWDRGVREITRSQLLEQEFLAGFGVGANFRITGTDVPTYSASGNSRQYGWLLDLPDTSDAGNTAAGAPERVVSRSVVIGDIVFFNTLVPTTNGCDVGGYGYLMSVETKNGGRPDSPIINVDTSDTIDDGDFIDVGGSVDAAATGKKTDQGILSEPTFLGDKRYESTSKGEIIKDNVDPGGTTSTGRFSWTEIRNE
ncbi:MAG: hypothetical protein KAT25_02105 [Sulfuriflexus sp.]|nr:hypothetical protein [Sulfuriflexus sp.]